MDNLAEASLEPHERRILTLLVHSLEQEFGPALCGIWLYGSRARGEPAGDESDVDLIVVSTRAGRDDQLRAIRLGAEIAIAEGANPGGRGAADAGRAGGCRLRGARAVPRRGRRDDRRRRAFR